MSHREQWIMDCTYLRYNAVSLLVSKVSAATEY